MNKRLIVLLVAFAVVAGVAGVMYMSGGGDSPAGNGLSGRNKDVQVHSGTTEQAVVEARVTRAGKPAKGVAVEIHQGSATGPIVGAQATGPTGVAVFGGLGKGDHVLTADGSEPVTVTVKGNGITKASLTLR